MTYDDFYQIVDKHTGYGEIMQVQKGTDWEYCSYMASDKGNIAPALIKKWDADKETKHYGETEFRKGTAEPINWETLEDILEETAPTITFLQYQKLMRLTLVSTRSDNDYYNPSYDNIRLIEIEELYNFLNDNNILKED